MSAPHPHQFLSGFGLGSTREPKATFDSFIGQCAKSDPQLAWALLQAASQPGGLVDSGGWEILNLEGTFVTGEQGETIDAVMQGIVEADLWLRAVTYTVRRPNAYAGNILKAQSDVENAKNPNVDVSLLVSSFCQFLITGQASNTPLENLPSVFSCACPAGLVLRATARITSQLFLKRDLDDEVGEVPYNVVISLHTTRLPIGLYSAATREQAVAMLQELGFFQEVGLDAWEHQNASDALRARLMRGS